MGRKQLLQAIPALSAVCLFGQIPAQEDLETKSKREIFREGLEMREVRESSAKDVGEALSRIEGVSKLRKGAIANDVVIRGFQGGDINLLIDGVRIYGACPGQMDPSAFHVDFAEVERIELTKGGFDLANHGSLGGSVNVIRKRSSPGIHLSPSIQFGSFGYISPSITGSAGNETFELLGGYSYRRSKPFRNGRGDLMTSIGGYRPVNQEDDAFRIQTGWAQLRFSAFKNQSGELAYTRQDGAHIFYPYLQMDSPYDIADRLSGRYEFRNPVTGVERVRLDGYYTTVRHWMTDEWRVSSITARDVYSMATFARTRVAGGRAGFFFNKDLTAGIEAFQRNWDAVNSMRSMMMVTDQNVVPNVNTTIAGAYVDWNHSFSERLRIGVGARLDTANMAVRDGKANTSLYLAYKRTGALQRRDTNASGQLHVSFGLTEQAELFAGIASTVRTPDAQERYFSQRRAGSDWVGNPGVNPTRNNEAQAGLSWRHRAFFVKPGVFYSRLNDFIVIQNQSRRAPAPGVMNASARSYDNVSARLYGGELTYGWSIGSRWAISGGASYVRGSKEAAPQLNIFNTNLPEIPPLRGRTAIRYGRRTWFSEVEGIAARPQRRVDTDLLETPTAGFAVANIKFGIHLRRFTVTAGIDNLFDHYYLEHLSYQRDPFRNGARVTEPGRSVFVNVGYSF